MNQITTPFNPEFYHQQSFVEAIEIMECKKKQNIYNFTTLPETAILINQNVMGKRDLVFKKKLKGLSGKAYILNNDYMLCTSFGNGAPAVVTLMEELRAFGLRHFIFAGFAGSLNWNYDEGEKYFVKDAISTTGCSFFYDPNQKIETTASLGQKRLVQKLLLKQATCWSTDAPYRETKYLLTHFKEQGATHVDMECAAIYAFTRFFALHALCIIIAADSFQTSWRSPQDFGKLNKQLKSLLMQIISCK